MLEVRVLTFEQGPRLELSKLIMYHQLYNYYCFAETELCCYVNNKRFTQFSGIDIVSS